MGQYYKPVNESTLEFLYSHNYDNGLKLMEHSYLNNNFVRAVEALIGPGGAWEGAVVRWEGDYADPLPERDGNLYHLAQTEIHPEPIEKSRQFVINHTKKLFVDTEKQPVNWGTSRIHPLPLLICNGNGRGGGDYHSGTDMGLVGSWCGNVVTTSDQIPEGYEELLVAFRETRG